MIISMVSAEVILWSGKPHLMQGCNGKMDYMVTRHTIFAAAKRSNFYSLELR